MIYPSTYLKQRLLQNTSLSEEAGVPFDGTSGFYSKVFPTDYSKRKLSAWANKLRPLDARLYEDDKFHCTVIWSKVIPKSVGSTLVPAAKGTFVAKLDHFEYWDGHDKDGYVVAVLQSPDLKGLHENWKSHGAVHSFSQYEPHVTLFDKFIPTPYLHRQLRMLSQKEKGSILSFNNETLENLKP